VLLDATYYKVRVGGDMYGGGARVVSRAFVIAPGFRADGRRKVLVWAVGDSETEDFWAQFLGTLGDVAPGRTHLVSFAQPTPAPGFGPLVETISLMQRTSTTSSSNHASRRARGNHHLRGLPRSPLAQGVVDQTPPRCCAWPPAC